ncbi:hypothetical protein BJV82DRAFT_619733 [Fennellomyces sp. T-0311]|nr:hypothetical protein BJV82DRAFT_619733 [Fennellomyces sp. T-0311]
MTHDHPNDSSLTSAMQLAFMATLPSDITLEIFALLNQHDCLTAMTVCQDWLYAVPEYTKGLWNTIVIDTSKTNEETHKCWERFLGEHVKNVTIGAHVDEQVLYDVLQQLLDLNCTKIESLELVGCSTTQQNTFLSLLRRLSLIRLKMTIHRSNVAFAHVFNACPNMTHFTYQPTLVDDTFDSEPEVLDVPDLPDQFPSVTYLCLDMILDVNQRLVQLLKRCPNLQCYIGASLENLDTQRPDHQPVDFDLLFTLCPKITHVVTDWGYDSFYHLSDIEVGTLNSANGIRYFAAMEDRYNAAQVKTLIAANQSTIEHLSLRAHVFSFSSHGATWSNVFQSFSLPRLRTLICNSGFKIDNPTLIAILGPTVKILKLENGSSLEFNDQLLLQSLPVFPLLHTLEFSELTIDTDRSVIALFERLPALEDLILSYSTLTPALFQATLGSLRNLKYFDLFNIKWKQDALGCHFSKLVASKLKYVRISWTPHINYELLLKFVHAPMLTHLDIMMDQTICNTGYDGLMQLVTVLNKRIEELNLQNIPQVPFTVFNALCELPYLQRLLLNNEGAHHMNVTSAPLQVDKAGLIHILQNSKRLTAVNFSKLSVVDNLNQTREDGENDGELTCDEFNTLINEQVPSYQLFTPEGSYGMKLAALYSASSVSLKRK